MNEFDDADPRLEIPDAPELYRSAVESLSESRQELAALQQKVAIAETRVNTLRRLLASERNMDIPAVPMGPEFLLESCVQVFAARGDLRLSDLRDALFEKGVPIPGQGSNANLVGYLNRSGGRILRKRRGVYGLPDDEKTGSASRSSQDGCSPLS